MTVLVVLILVILAFVVKFLIDNSNLRDEVAISGGIEANFPAWYEFFDSQNIEVIRDEGYEIEVAKKFYSSSLKEDCMLFMTLKAGYANTLNGYIVTSSGKKFKGQELSFSGPDNKQSLEAVNGMVKRFMASFEMQGIFN